MVPNHNIETTKEKDQNLQGLVEFLGEKKRIIDFSCGANHNIEITKRKESKLTMIGWFSWKKKKRIPDSSCGA